MENLTSALIPTILNDDSDLYVQYVSFTRIGEFLESNFVDYELYEYAAIWRDFNVSFKLAEIVFKNGLLLDTEDRKDLEYLTWRAVIELIHLNDELNLGFDLKLVYAPTWDGGPGLLLTGEICLLFTASEEILEQYDNLISY